MTSSPDSNRSAFKGPLFIIGLSRSGTKLLHSLLENHPDIALTDELLFIPYFLKKWGAEDLSNPEIFTRMYEDIEKMPYMTRKKTRNQLISAGQWRGLCKDFEPDAVIEQLIRFYTNNWQTDCIWGDKAPSYIHNIKTLKTHFPGAKFILIVRDVRDASVSAYHAWGKSKIRFAQRWADGLNVAISQFREISSNDYLEVRYEDLLRKPDNTLMRCCSFLGLPYSCDYLRLKKPSENLGSAKGMAFIKTDNFDKYLENLSKIELRKIEQLSWRVLERYGYKFEYRGPVKRLSKAEQTLYLIFDTYRQFVSDLKEQGIGQLGIVINLLIARLKIFKSKG